MGVLFFSCILKNCPTSSHMSTLIKHSKHFNFNPINNSLSPFLLQRSVSMKYINSNSKFKIYRRSEKPEPVLDPNTKHHSTTALRVHQASASVTRQLDRNCCNQQSAISNQQSAISNHSQQFVYTILIIVTPTIEYKDYKKLNKLLSASKKEPIYNHCSG